MKPTTRLSTVTLAFSVLVSSLAGCIARVDDEPADTTHTPDEPAPPPTLYDAGGVVVRGQCTAACVEGKRRCEAKANRDYDSCTGGCFENPYDTYCDCCYCLDIRRDTETRCDNLCAQSDSCGESNFEVEITGASPELEAACLEWDSTFDCFNYTNDFGVTFDGSDFCPQFALVEDPTYTSFYECMIESRSCDAACGQPAADTAGTQQVCDDLAACGQGCNSEQEEFLLHNLAWLRHDVRGALDTCMLLSCGEGRVHCFRQWAVAVSHFTLQPAQY